MKVEAESNVISATNGGLKRRLTIDAANPIVTTRPISVCVSLTATSGKNIYSAGTVISDSRLNINVLNLTPRGAGAFNVNLNATQLTTWLSAAGTANLRGNATNHTTVLLGRGLVSIN